MKRELNIKQVRPKIPTVGLIVHYMNGGRIYPAIIVSVGDNMTCELYILDKTLKDQFNIVGYSPELKNGHWSWAEVATI